MSPMSGGLTPLGRSRRPGGIDITSVTGFLEAYDMSQASYRWQDTGRTIQASATNDPVALLDPVSGTTGRRLSSPSSGVRPIVSSGGLITFDGVNDYLWSNTWAGGTIADMTVVWSATLNASNRNSFDRWFSITPTGTTDASSGFNASAAVNNGSLRTEGLKGALTIASTVASGEQVYSWQHSGTAVTAWVNGTQVATSSMASSNVVAGIMALCAYIASGAINTSYSAPLTYRRWAIFNSALSSTDRATAEAWAAGG